MQPCDDGVLSLLARLPIYDPFAAPADVLQVLCTRLGTKPLCSARGPFWGALGGLSCAAPRRRACTCRHAGKVSSHVRYVRRVLLLLPQDGWQACGPKLLLPACVCYRFDICQDLLGVCRYRLTLQCLLVCHCTWLCAAHGVCAACARGDLCRLDSILAKRNALRPCTPCCWLVRRLLVLPVRLLLGTVYLSTYNWHPLFCCPI
jgi:hypothetical protein